MRQEADGDSVAHAEVFAHFYARHYRLVLTVAQQRLSGVADAEDVAAETFRITWAHHQSGGDLSLPWVYKVLRNIIGNEYQRVARSTELFTGSVGSAAIAPTGWRPQMHWMFAGLWQD